MTDKKQAIKSLRQLSERYHEKESKEITDEELWHANGVFMKAVTTRKDFFIRAMTTADSELVTMTFFQMLYGVMQLAYREKTMYLSDTMMLEEFCKNNIGMDDEETDSITTSFTLATSYGFEVTEEEFIESINRLLRKKKQEKYKELIGDSIKKYKEGDITGADELINRYVSDCKGLSERNRPVTLSALSESAIDRYNHPQGSIIETGYSKLDALTGGGRKGLTWIVGGYTADGKTTMCMNMVYNAIIKGHTALWVTLELPTADMQTMFEARHAMALGYGRTVTFQKIDQRKFSDEEYCHYRAVVDDLKKYDNLIIYEPERSFDIDDLVTEIDRIKAYRELDIVVVDYLELIDPTKDMKYDPYRIRVKRTMRDARLIARRKDVWMIIPHQISRGGREKAEERAQKEGDPYYTLGDLQESSGVEQNCAVMTWIYQDEHTRTNDTARMGIGKNTKGAIEVRGWDVSVDNNSRQITNKSIVKM